MPMFLSILYRYKIRNVFMNQTYHIQTIFNSTSTFISTFMFIFISTKLKSFIPNYIIIVSRFKLISIISFIFISSMNIYIYYIHILSIPYHIHIYICILLFILMHIHIFTSSYSCRFTFMFIIIFKFMIVFMSLM